MYINDSHMICMQLCDPVWIGRWLINILSPAFKINNSNGCSSAVWLGSKTSHMHQRKSIEEMTSFSHGAVAMIPWTVFLHVCNRATNGKSAWRSLTLPSNSGICWSTSSNIWNFNSFNWSLYIFYSLINDICSFSFTQPCHLFSDIFCSSLWYALQI